MNKTIIAVTNQKGGVGKTTTSINLSTGLAASGHKTLLIDLDPQAHSTIGIGIEPGSYKKAINDVLINQQNINDVILETKTSDLFIAPSHIHLERTEQILSSELFKEARLHRAIRNLDYEFIIIDCRPSLGTLTVNALYACNFILVPCESSRYSLEGFADLIDTIEHVQNSEGMNQDKNIRILLTKYDPRNKRTNEWLITQLEPYKQMKLESVIRTNEALNQAHIACTPIYLFQPNCHGSEDYEKLTKEVISLCRT